jgi:hypothetical protein
MKVIYHFSPNRTKKLISRPSKMKDQNKVFSKNRKSRKRTRLQIKTRQLLPALILFQQVPKSVECR